MNPELLKSLEDSINFVDKAEDENKQLLLKIRTVDEDIKQLREYRDSLKAKRNLNIEKLKEIAIYFENIAKENGLK